MKFGLFAMNYGTCAEPSAAVEVARHAEAAGLESLWVAEHVVLPSPQPDGFSLPPTLSILDPVVSLALLACATREIKLGTGILVLPQRNPVILAKELASVDRIAKGRVILGVGTGYVAEEFAAVGVPFSQRGARTDEYLGALEALWTMNEPRYSGRFVSFEGVESHPRPLQHPSIPVVVGGASRGALRRAVTRANGWYGFGVDVDGAAACIEALRHEAKNSERPKRLGDLEITVTPVGELSEAIVDRYEALGVDRLVLLPQPDAPREHRHAPVPLDQIRRNIDWISSQFLA